LERVQFLMRKFYDHWFFLLSWRWYCSFLKIQKNKKNQNLQKKEEKKRKGKVEGLVWKPSKIFPINTMLQCSRKGGRKFYRHGGRRKLTGGEQKKKLNLNWKREKPPPFETKLADPPFEKTREPHLLPISDTVAAPLFWLRRFSSLNSPTKHSRHPPHPISLSRSSTQWPPHLFLGFSPFFFSRNQPKLGPSLGQKSTRGELPPHFPRPFRHPKPKASQPNSLQRQ